MRKPNILVLLPFLVKGALIIKIIRFLRCNGFDVAVAFRTDASKIYPVDPLADFQSDGKLIDLRKISQPDCLKSLNNEIINRNIDLIVQVGAFDLYHVLPYLSLEKPGIKIIDILYNEYGHTLNHFLYEKCIDCVIVESNSMKHFVERASEKSGPNVRVVNNGVDLNLYSPAREKPLGNNLVIGYIGRMSDEKNPLGFVDLAEFLLEFIPDISIRMFGSGDQEGVVLQRVINSSQRSKLKFEGYVEHVKDALHELDVLILPSKFDGRPNIIMEANACGIPVIASPVGGVPELVCDGVNGYLVAPQSHAKIGEIISTWIEFPDELSSIKQSSREHAISYFDDNKMLHDYAAVFISVASSNGSGVV